MTRPSLLERIRVLWLDGRLGWHAAESAEREATRAPEAVLEPLAELIEDIAAEGGEEEDDDE